MTSERADEERLLLVFVALAGVAIGFVAGVVVASSLADSDRQTEAEANDLEHDREVRRAQAHATELESELARCKSDLEREKLWSCDE